MEEKIVCNTNALAERRKKLIEEVRKIDSYLSKNAEEKKRLEAKKIYDKFFGAFREGDMLKAVETEEEDVITRFLKLPKYSDDMAGNDIGYDVFLRLTCPFLEVKIWKDGSFLYCSENDEDKSTFSGFSLYEDGKYEITLSSEEEIAKCFADSVRVLFKEGGGSL